MSGMLKRSEIETKCKITKRTLCLLCYVMFYCFFVCLFFSFINEGIPFLQQTANLSDVNFDVCGIKMAGCVQDEVRLFIPRKRKAKIVYFGCQLLLSVIKFYCRETLFDILRDKNISSGTVFRILLVERIT